jgi:plastocyanin
MLNRRRAIRGSLGLIAALGVSALAGISALASGSTGIGITITTGTCAGGGTSFCFTPEAATAQTGAPVTWTDRSSVAHQMAPCTPSACPGAPASSGSDPFDVSVAADGHGSFTFTSAGTYYYYCTLHGYAAMHGRITVTPPATAPPTPSPVPTVRPTPRPTQRPSMKPESPAPTRSVSAGTVSPAPQPPTLPPTTVVTANPVPSTGNSPSIPTPALHRVAAVNSGSSPALPAAIVAAILLAAVATAWYLARRHGKRQTG